jgi:CheY-like chemotaxis protein
VNVLLIDDNEAVRYGSKLALESSGKGRFNVVTAGEGEQAITLLRQPHSFSVAVLDLHLPDCDGTGLFSTMRSLAPQLPVIVISGIPEQQLVARFNQQRPDGFLVKPFDGDTLIQQIIAVVHGEKPTAV